MWCISIAEESRLRSVALDLNGVSLVSFSMLPDKIKVS